MKLIEIRNQIDEIDDQIIDLLVKRANLAKYAFEAKKKEGKTLHLIPEREERVFDRMSKIAQAKLGIPVPNVFVEIISVCRHLEKQTNILVLKSQLKNAEIAITKRFGHLVNIVAAQTLDEFIARLEQGSILGFIVKNSVELSEISKCESLSIIGEYGYNSLLNKSDITTYSLVSKS